MSGYESLTVYQRSYKAAKAMRKITKEMPETERYALIDQMNRASLSIPLNIAEGYAKKESQAEFRRYLLMAIGSANEMSVLVDFAKDLEYIEKDRHEKAKKEYEEISKMLRVLIEKTKQK